MGKTGIFPAILQINSRDTRKENIPGHNIGFDPITFLILSIFAKDTVVCVKSQSSHTDIHRQEGLCVFQLSLAHKRLTCALPKDAKRWREESNKIWVTQLKHKNPKKPSSKFSGKSHLGGRGVSGLHVANSALWLLTCGTGWLSRWWWPWAPLLLLLLLPPTPER